MLKLLHSKIIPVLRVPKPKPQAVVSDDFRGGYHFLTAAVAKREASNRANASKLLRSFADRAFALLRLDVDEGVHGICSSTTA